ncbi:probable membrane-associated kinase regulator 6 [Gastrolobium bilobum]|uniref:probable membrane-associated kinase regulator 6 n=1 Tax=Gastrolobium bilobum TaxID=150636 RepID=UPI002AB1576A|nr:probable membrane-associated kinase regulator 6 [Gastrolobium bilobum]
METSVPLASDSFSYSWLSDCKSPLDGLEEPLRESVYSSYEGTSAEFNSTMINSDNLRAECQNFDFDISITQSPVVLVHADEIFSDGLVMPIFVDPSKVESCNTPDPSQTMLGSSFSSRTVSPRTMEIHHGFLTRWRKSTWRTLLDFFGCINQLRHKVGGSRKSTRVDDIDKTDWQVRSLSSSQKSSPKPITTHPIGDSNDHENSIYEAVLHCKRSLGK